MEEDVRWKQRFSNFAKALRKLNQNIDFIRDSDEALNLEQENISLELVSQILDILKQGLIQSFEFTHELAWKVMQDFAKDQGNTEIRGSKDATRWAAQVGLITDAQSWMNMILNRNQTSHTYNDDTANEIFSNILKVYYLLLSKFEENIKSLADVR